MAIRLTALAALALLIGTLPSAPLPFPGDRSKADLKAMQGAWEVVELTAWFPGKPGEGPFHFMCERPGVFIAVSGGDVRWTHGDGLSALLTLRLIRPGWIDTTPRPGVKGGGAFGPRQAEGIYKVEKDTLTICDGPESKRPPGTGWTSRGSGSWS